MTLGISELVAKIGDDNIQIQNLDTCAISMDYRKGKQTEIRFGTDVKLMPDGTELMGVILWMPRDKVAAVVAGGEGE